MRAATITTSTTDARIDDRNTGQASTTMIRMSPRRSGLAMAASTGDGARMPLSALARDAVSGWCNALPARDYVVTVRDSTDGRAARARFGREDLLGALAWLRHRNALGAHVEARPWSTRHVIVDGLTPACAERLAAEHDPVLLVEAGLGLVQAWVTVAENEVEPEVAAAVARHLATRFGGLIPAASARAVGRLPAFTHPAEQRCADGQPRFLRITASRSPGVDRRAADLLARARAGLACAWTARLRRRPAAACPRRGS
jgi:hypothetical protein